ncbi:MAG: AmmeMemoRadiSam system protein B [Bacteroidales bacterium]|nr:AmmeMemoRadiSam system protein B [Bacteroidales bacterium]
MMQDTNYQTREPVVAGQFYPASKDALDAELIKLFSDVKDQKTSKGINNQPEILAVISPHAGYVFSGSVAAAGYKQLNPKKQYQNIFLIGSSHRTYFNGASIYNKGNYRTPLGDVKVNLSLANMLINKYDVFKFREDAHNYEHSLEVQLPFLQHILEKEFTIVPVIIGSQDKNTCKKIAEALKPYFNQDNLFVISSDFSHYPDYTNAVKVDGLTAQAIISNNPDNLLEQIQKNEKSHISNLATSLCGWTSVLTLMYLSQDIPDVQYIPVVYKNSGDVEHYGEKSRVVGYYSICLEQKPVISNTNNFLLSHQDKEDLIKIARNTVNSYVRFQKRPAIEENLLSDNLKTPAGAFVTLHKKGQLRGCIGRFDPDIPLFKVIQDMAIAASTRDYRFTPVTPDELDQLDIEISVLTPLKKINSIEEIVLGKHGIYIKKDHQSGTFLPQVATQTGWSLDEFLGHCAKDKAGLGWNGWIDAELYTFEAIIFSEKDL